MVWIGLRARPRVHISREERGLSSADPSRTPGFWGGIFLGLSVELATSYNSVVFPTFQLELAALELRI